MWKLGRDFDLSSRDVIRESMADLGTLKNNVLGGREKWSLDGLCQNLVRHLRITFWAEKAFQGPGSVLILEMAVFKLLVKSSLFLQIDLSGRFDQ